MSAATTCTSAFGRLLWERFFTVNESRQTVETDTLWLSKNIHALNFRKPGHLRKYCNNENFPIYGITCLYMYVSSSYIFSSLYLTNWWSHYMQILIEYMFESCRRQPDLNCPIPHEAYRTRVLLSTCAYISTG